MQIAACGWAQAFFDAVTPSAVAAARARMAPSEPSTGFEGAGVDTACAAPRCRVVLFLGRLAPEKSPGLFLRAAFALRARARRQRLNDRCAIRDST